MLKPRKTPSSKRICNLTVQRLVDLYANNLDSEMAEQWRQKIEPYE